MPSAASCAWSSLRTAPPAWPPAKVRPCTTASSHSPVPPTRMGRFPPAECRPRWGRPPGHTGRRTTVPPGPPRQSCDGARPPSPPAWGRRCRWSCPGKSAWSRRRPLPRHTALPAGHPAWFCRRPWGPPPDDLLSHRRLPLACQGCSAYDRYNYCIRSAPGWGPSASGQQKHQCQRSRQSPTAAASFSESSASLRAFSQASVKISSVLAGPGPVRRQTHSQTPGCRTWRTAASSTEHPDSPAAPDPAGGEISQLLARQSPWQPSAS